MTRIWNEVLDEARTWRRDWPLLVFGLFAAYADGVIIAYAWTWAASGSFRIWI